MFSLFKKDTPLIRACRNMSRNGAPSAPPSNDAELTKTLGWFIVKMSLSYFKERRHS